MQTDTPQVARRTLAGFELIIEAFQSYPVRSFVIVAAVLFAGLAEGVGVAAVLPVLSIAVGDGEATRTELGKAVAEFLQSAGIPNDLPILLALVVAGFLLKAALLLLAMQQVGFASARISTNLRFRLLRSVLNTKWAYYSGQPAGSMANAMTTEATNGGATFVSAYQIVAMVIQVAVYVALALLVAWQVTVASLVAGVIIILVMARLVFMTRHAAERAARAFNELLRRLTDALAGIKPLKAMAAHEQVGMLMEAEALSLNVALQRSVIARETMKWFREPIVVGFMALGLFFVLRMWDIPFEIVLVMAVLFYRTVNRIAELQQTYQQLVNSEVFYSRIKEKIRMAEEERELFSGRSAPTFMRAIKVEDVWFSFGGHSVLRGASMTVPVRKMTTLCGSSGVGKTTIADMILGFHLPDKGQVMVDDAPLCEIDLFTWRKTIGYVPQDTFLFHDSILRNVTLGDPALSESDAEEALRAAEAWSFIELLPDAIHTVVGERGSRLSGGQRQRVAIARALIRQPQFLLLDEPTSGLDPATENDLCATLRLLSRTVTILSITHQQALAAAADQVLQMRDGQVFALEDEHVPLEKLDFAPS